MSNLIPKRRVVVTGIGIVSPLGNTSEDTWAGLLAGRSGVDYITKFDTSQHTVKFAAEIAARAPVALRLAKEAVNAVFETSLQAGLAHERRLFYMLFSTEDQKEGMDAFINKRPASWQGK